MPLLFREIPEQDINRHRALYRSTGRIPRDDDGGGGNDNTAGMMLSGVECISILQILCQYDDWRRVRASAGDCA